MAIRRVFFGSPTTVSDYPGTGTLALASTLSGEGVLNRTGTGALTALPVLDASGVLNHSGDGALSLLPVLTAEGALKHFADASLILEPLLDGEGTRDGAVVDWSGDGVLNLLPSLVSDGVLDHVGEGVLSLSTSLSGEGSVPTVTPPTVSGGGPGRVWSGKRPILVETRDRDWETVLRAIEDAEKSAQKILAKKVIRLGKAQKSIEEIKSQVRGFESYAPTVFQINSLKSKVNETLDWLQRSRAAEYRRLVREIERHRKRAEADEEDEWVMMF